MTKPIKLPLAPGECIVFDFISGTTYVGVLDIAIKPKPNAE